MAVVGIDMGAATFTVAQAAGQATTGRGGISIVLNEGTSRFTPALVTFHENKRHIGQLAAPLKKAQFKKTVTNIKRLLGKKYTDPGVEEELARCFFKTVQMEDGGIGCVVQHNGKERTFTPTQILAMQFSNVMAFTKAWSKKQNVDFVCSVPSYFSVAQRLAVRDAATIAGVDVLRLLNEGTAAALSYGIFKQGLDEKKPHRVMFVDMGYAQYTVTIVEFTKNGLQVVGSASDPNIGGRNFDEAIADRMASEFKAQSGVDVKGMENKKSWIKLLEAAAKLKKTLTPFGVNVAQCGLECLYRENDFRTSLKQDDFDKMFAWVVDRIPGPINDALKQANLTPKDIEATQLIGGTTRIPLVKQTIAKTMGTDESKQNFGLSCTLNPDECIARGCALQSAMISPLLRVRPYGVKDCIVRPIRITWQQPSATGSGTAKQSIDIFKTGDAYPAYKRVTFKRDESFTITAEYSNGESAEDQVVGTFKVGGHADMKNNESPKIKVNIAYDPDGIFSVKSAHFMKEKPVEVEPEEAKPAENDTKTDSTAEKPSPEGDGEKPATEGAEKPATEGDTKPAEDPKSDEGASDKADTKNATETAKPPEPEKKKPAEKPKPKFIQVGLEVDSTVTGALVKARIDDLRNQEAQLAQEERIARERDERRNDLETYVYDIRDKVESYSYESFMDGEARTKYVQELEDMEEWLYTEEGNDSAKGVYVDKLKNLRKVGDFVLKLKKEHEGIPEAIDAFKAAQAADLKVVESEDEQYAHITAEERDTVKKTWAEGLKYVDDNVAKNTYKVESLANLVALSITIADIARKQQECVGKCRSIVNKPKPKPKPVEPEPEEPKPEESKPEGDKKEGEANKGSEGKSEGKTDSATADKEEGKSDTAESEKPASSAEAPQTDELD